MVTKKILKTIFKLRRATEAEWEEKNPILALGEPGFAYDVYGLKIGNGETSWSELEYIGITINQLMEFLSTVEVEDLADGADYAKKEYVDQKFENLIIDCGTSTTVLWGE